MSTLPELREMLDTATARSIKAYEAVCVLCFSVMILIALIQIGNRHIPIEHQWSLRWTVAWSVRFMLFTAFLSIGLVHIHDEDIVISAFPDWLESNTSVLFNNLYKFILNLAVLGMLGFLSFTTYQMMMSSWDVGTSPDFFFWFRRGHLYMFMFIGLTVALLYRFVKTVETVHGVLGAPVRERLQRLLDETWN